jgi:CheY-like chemotaxis protein
MACHRLFSIRRSMFFTQQPAGLVPGTSRQRFLLFNPGWPIYPAKGLERKKLPMKTIFLVEDDPVVVHVYRAKFLREGFAVEVAQDGLAALKMLQTIKPDVVILDLMMPKMNGVDVLKYIRSNPALKKTPVIILSNAHAFSDMAAIRIIPFSTIRSTSRRISFSRRTTKSA